MVLFNPLFFLQHISDNERTQLVQHIALITNDALIISAQLSGIITGKQKKYLEIHMI